MKTRHLIIAGLSISLSLLAGCSGTEPTKPIQTTSIEVPETKVVSTSTTKDITTETYISPLDDATRELLKPTDKEPQDERLTMSDTLSATSKYIENLTEEEKNALTDLSPDIIAQLNTSTTPEQLAKAKEAMQGELEVIIDEQLDALNKQIEIEKKIAKQEAIKIAKEKARKEKLKNQSKGATLASIGSSGESDNNFYVYKETTDENGELLFDEDETTENNTTNESEDNDSEDSSDSEDTKEEAGESTSEITVKATFYDALCDTGCIGITKTGIDVRNRTPNIIAVDPTVIPLHTIVELIIDGKSWGIYQAEDTGGAIKGNRIDILSPSRGQAFQDGVKHNVKVRILDRTSAQKKEAYQKLLAGN